MNKIMVSENAQKVIDLGRANNMTFKIADPNEWILEPLFFLDYTVPSEGLGRAYLILKSGIPVQGFYKAHEVETKPEVKPQVKPLAVPTNPTIDWGNVAKVAGVVAGAMAMGVAALGALLAMAILSDPAIIVKSDNIYLIIYSWEAPRENHHSSD